jgi:gliding motility-associated-like protein
VKYLDTLGGCVANPFELRMRYGRKIMPKIQLDSASRYASITPAEFEFGNASSFTPPKTGSKYDWDFGKGLNTSNNNATTFGLVNTNAVYELPNKSGEGYTVTLTAYDTLFSSAVQVGKVCQNQDSIKVFVQNLIPSLVTNNGDGVNDNFSIQGMRANTFSMKLYNRWGKLVADQDPFSIEGWDPKDVGPGVYYYILTEKRSGKNLVSWLTISK